ncbi:DNA helicase C2 [Neoasaia chiangmaiensis NBRC 101099]|uniref:DNA helicase n=1 Tax=Neoasaia chiangmaiensis TaxID=320497 RepID=A0A1U9KMW1_9PROT|nr:ATP-dependent DNA helicase [Neoasaia chiangmaiensis]AQS87132.1 DNA helicase [Neoasaia chiangmaiensis]GBR38137.1 DNA helicase C2 [Neoasaia chiangmaiensis NBRC 101099]GEN16028.1 DNA helicase [Neoasaia chiangmaiensis]
MPLPRHRFTSPYDAPALVAHRGKSSVLSPDGELLDIPSTDVARQLAQWAPPLMVHGPATFRFLEMGSPPPPATYFDLLELFLFVSPATNAAPTPRGLALALAIPAPARIEADFLHVILNALLAALRTLSETRHGDTMRALLPALSRAGWPWAGVVAETIGMPADTSLHPLEALRVWRRLPKWEETAPRPAPGSQPVPQAAARARLRAMLGPDAEERAGQADFASVATAAFAPRQNFGSPHIVLAEAGTGTGKTLGYVAPASVWAESNGGAVWISTYTRHLQRQIEQELLRLYPDEAARRRAVVVRKGRENYLCLLNMEDAVNTAASRGEAAGTVVIALSLLARWAEATQDGDLMGGDLPGWFGELFGAGTVFGMADRRGECIHGACPHYQRCFVEHTIRRARDADLVVANHALVMSQAAWNALGQDDVPEEDSTPTRYVFDEGHHLPDAADSAFAITFSGVEAAELRRWLLGAEGSRSRARGLRRRLEDLVAGVPSLETPLDAVLQAARALPAPGWLARLHEPENAVREHVPDTIANPSEIFLRALDQQARARQAAKKAQGDAECELHPVEPAVAESAEALSRALVRLSEPLEILVKRLKAQLTEETETLDAATRGRLEATIRTLQRRAISRVHGWISMLDATRTPPEPGTTPVHVDFIRTEAIAGRGPRANAERDVGLHRHWLDPTVPFASVMQAPAHGILVTSATLRDQTDNATGDDQETAWDAAEARLGATHFPAPALRAALMSPFDYARQTRAYVVSDLPRDDIDALAAAYRTLFLAANGGALGLFTAIARLRAVHKRIAEPLEMAGLPLYAQHVDAMDNATLVDVFKTEIDSCLLGTDAMRDGVDVPGNALRMVVFERTPWPRPDILHRERRLHLSHGAPNEYDDRLTRMKLRQAFGRLIRKATDRGVFVMLDRRMPTRLFSAFPEGVDVRRLPFDEAVRDIAAFLQSGENNA